MYQKEKERSAKAQRAPQLFLSINNAGKEKIKVACILKIVFVAPKLDFKSVWHFLHFSNWEILIFLLC
jgi:hypothetical protein